MSLGESIEDAFRCNMPEILPEVQDHLSKYFRKEVDGKQVYRLYRPEPGKTYKSLTAMPYSDFGNEYEFGLWLWSTNIFQLEKQAEVPKKKVERYRRAVNKIKELILERQKEFRQLEMQDSAFDGALDSLRGNFKRNAAEMTTEARKRQLEKIAKGALAKPDLPRISVIYRMSVADIDKPEDGKILWPNVRDLLDIYAFRIRNIEDQELAPLVNKIKCSKEYLELAQEQLKQFKAGKRK